jgi:hypothetical protein
MEIYVLWAVSIVLLCLTCYLFGEYRGSRNQYTPAVPHTPLAVTPQRFEVHETITGPIQIGVLEVTTTAVIDLIPTDAKRLLTVQKDRDDWKAKWQRAEHLHQVWLHNTRIARARYNKVVGVTFEASRRPTLERALAIVTDVGTARRPERVHLITPRRRQHWIESGLVAA